MVLPFHYGFIGVLHMHIDNYMITTETPYKLAEIIRDTWPGIYRNPQVFYNKEKKLNDERILGSKGK